MVQRANTTSDAPSGRMANSLGGIGYSSAGYNKLFTQVCTMIDHHDDVDVVDVTTFCVTLFLLSSPPFFLSFLLSVFPTTSVQNSILL
jgi:hypothetical protein